MQTLILKNANFRSNNFDFLRFLAASIVILYHSFPLYGNYSMPKSLGLITSLPLPAFFVISGFLITKSWIKNPNIVVFFQKRVLRIFPGLIGVVLLSLLIIGPIVIGFEGIKSYFSNPATWQYAENIIMRSRFYLPGVFTDNSYKGVVNGSLWTLPIEFWLYIFLSVLGLLKILIKKRTLMVILVLVMYILYRHLSGEADALKLSFLSLPVFLTLRYGILFFLGSAFYLFKEKIILKPFTFILALIILCNYKDDLAIFIALPYIVAYIALAVNNKVLRNWGKFGDFSYGLYVFAFPVQQLIMHYLGNKISLPVFFITSYLVTLSIAVISWNLIEKPAMRLKKVDLLGFLSIVYSKILKFILMGKNQVKEI